MEFLQPSLCRSFLTKWFLDKQKLFPSANAMRLLHARCSFGLPLLRSSYLQRVQSNFIVGHGHWARAKNRPQLVAMPASKQEEPSSQPEWDLAEAGSSKEWQRSDLHVVLVEPQIPQNAGNVSRTCAATSVALHLVGPMGFEIDSKKLKRAGLDYWHYVCVAVHPTWQDFYAAFQQQPGPKRLIAFSKFARKHYAEEGMYRPDCANWLMFGSETTGLPPEAHQAAVDSGGAVVKIPMVERHVRSLNLSTSVGIGLLEAIRQIDGAVLPEEQQLDPLAPQSDYNVNAGNLMAPK